MSERWLKPFATVAVAAIGTLTFATASWAADTTIKLHQENVKAAAFSEQKCAPTDPRMGDKAANEDGWHFLLPNAAGDDFVSLSLNFDNGGSAVNVKIPDATDAYLDKFYSAGDKQIHAYLFTPAGWTLVNGTAVVTRGGTEYKQDFFNLSHTCAGTATSPSPSPRPSITPSEPVPTPSGVVETTPPGTDPTTPGPVTTTPGGGLPKTGVAIGGFVIAGLGLIAGGVAMMAIRRRRELTDLAE